MKSAYWVALLALVALSCADLEASQPGGFKSVNVEDVDVQTAADFVWQTLSTVSNLGVDLENGIDLKVVSAAKQVVAGLNYKLTLAGTFNGEDVMVNAIVYKNLAGELSLISYNIHSTETSFTINGMVDSAAVGGFSPVSATDPGVQLASEFAWRSVAALPSSGIELSTGTGLRVASAQQQIVAGINYALELIGNFDGKQVRLSVVVWRKLDDSWELTSHTIHFVDENSDAVIPGLGGYTPISTEDPDALEASSFVWQKLAQNSGSGIKLSEGRDLSIVNAQMQVVAGINYKLKLNGYFNEIQYAVFATVFKDLSGNFNLVDYSIRQWVNYEQLAEVGSYSPLSVNDPDVEAASAFLWKEVSSIPGTGVELEGLSNVEVISAEAQVVAGINYRLSVKGVSNGKNIDIRAVVYRDPAGQFTLSSYTVQVDSHVEKLYQS